MTIEYDTPIEVSRTDYNNLMNQFSGIIAGTTIEGKYFIKLWLMKYKDHLEQAIIKLGY